MATFTSSLTSRLNLNNLPHHWTTDDRTAWNFTISGTSDSDESTLAIVPLCSWFWLDLICLLLVQVAFCAGLGVILYYALQIRDLYESHQPAKEHDSKATTAAKPRQSGPVASRLFLGYACFLPLWLFVIPSALLRILGIRNLVFRFCLAVIVPITNIFRLLAIIHSSERYLFVPLYAVRSLADFVLYLASPINLVVLSVPQGSKNKDHCRYQVATTQHKLQSLGKFLFYLILTGFYQSLFGTVQGFPPLGPSLSTTPDAWYELSQLLNPQQYKDSALYAMLFQLYLSLFGEGLILTTLIITNIQCQKLMDNPLLESTSPSDFWGRRWNLLIHDCLKRGAYFPVRTLTGNRLLAVLATFVASGLFHEWLLDVVFSMYHPINYGTTLLFFVWQAGLVGMEATVRVLTRDDAKHDTLFVGLIRSFRDTARSLPRPIQTALIILSGIPLAHWFCDPYVRSDFFEQGAVALPMFRLIATASVAET